MSGNERRSIRETHYPCACGGGIRIVETSPAFLQFEVIAVHADGAAPWHPACRWVAESIMDSHLRQSQSILAHVRWRFPLLRGGA